MTRKINPTDRRSRSGGKAAAGGFNFQAHSTAALYLSVLSGKPFAIGLTPAYWPPLHPKTVSVETGLGGDDIRVCLADGSQLEVQAKRRAIANMELFKTIEKIGAMLQTNQTWRGALICGTSSSASVRDQLRIDIERLADGRDDDLSEVTARLTEHLNCANLDLRSLAARFSIIVLTESHPAELSSLVNDGASALWKTLIDDAHRQIALRGRRSLHQLVQVVQAHGFKPETDFNESEAHTLASYTAWLAKKMAHFRVPGCDARVPVDKSIGLKIAFDVPEGETGEHEDVIERYYATNENKRDVPESDGHFAIDFNRKVAIIGGPGSGKSLLLRRIAYRLSRRALPVIYIQLRDLTRLADIGGRGFSESLEQLAFDGFDHEFPKRQLLRNAKYLIADGLDECGDFAERVASWLDSWTDAHPNVQVLVATRLVGFDRHWLPDTSWSHAVIQPLSERYADRHLTALLDAMSIFLAGETPLRAIRRRKTREERDRSRWSSPLTIALAASLIARGTPLPGHEADLLRKFVDCYRPRSPTERTSTVSIAQPILDRILQCIAAALRKKPSIEKNELLNVAAADVAPELGATPLAATGEVEKALHFWEQRGILERLHITRFTYYAFAHMQLCESVAADYWSSESTRNPERFRNWLLSAISDSQQWEVVRLLARSGDIAQIFDAIVPAYAPGMLASEDLICRLADLLAYAGPEQVCKLGIDRQRAIEKMLLEMIGTGVSASSRCAIRWIDLPWTASTDSRECEDRLLARESEDARICRIVLRFLRSPNDLDVPGVVETLRSRVGTGLTVSPTGGLCIHATSAAWTLRNRFLVAIFKTLTSDSQKAILDAAQSVLDNQNYSSDVSADLVGSAAAAGLSVSAAARSNWHKDFYTEEDRQLDHQQDIWFLDKLASLTTTSPNPSLEAVRSNVELRDVGAVWSALGASHVYVNEYLDLSDPVDSIGLQAVLRGLCNVMTIDVTAMSGEIYLIRERLRRESPPSLFSLLPNIPVTNFSLLHSPRDRKFVPGASIVDALFHKSRAVAYTATRLIEGGNCEDDLGELVDARLQNAPSESLRCIAAIAKEIWSDRWRERLNEELDRPPRPGLCHFAERLLDESGTSANTRIYENVLRLTEQENVYDAATFASLLPRFEKSLHEIAPIRRLLEYWQTHHPPFRNGEFSYVSPLVPLVAILKLLNDFTEDDRVRLRRVDRSDVRKSLD